MTFLQPLILFGLAAAVIPLVLHLLTLRRLRTVDFSTLAFLKELQRSRIRKLRLRQWLLLLLRTLLILLLVLAFARPTLQGTLPDAWGATARTTAVILIDDSFSMTVVDGKGELLRQAREAAAGIVRSLREGDEAALLVLSSAGSPTTDPTSILPLIEESASHVQPSAVRRSLEDGMRAAAAILSRSHNANKELYLISDLQRTVLERSIDRSIPGLEDPAVSVFAVPLGDRPAANVSLGNVRFPGSLVAIGKPLAFEAAISNRGPQPATSAIVSLFLDTERMDQRSRDLAPESSQDVSVSATPRRTGFLTARLEVEGDEVEFDNVRHVSLRLRKELRILLVGTDADMRFVRLALRTRTDSVSAFYRTTVVSPEDLNGSTLAGHDAVIVAAGSPSLDRWAGALRSLAESGTGMVLVPGASAERWGTLGTAFGLGNEPRVTSADGAFTTFRSADVDHPVFAGVFLPTAPNGRERVQVPSPDVRRFLPTQLPERGVAVVTMSNGQPFLVEASVGQGRFIALSTACIPAWSDLPYQGLFVPLIHQSVGVVTGARDIRPIVTAGSEVVLPAPAGRRGAVRIVRPDRQTAVVAPIATPNGAVIKYDGTSIPGVYAVWMEDVEEDRFTVAIDDRETDTRAATDDERGAFFRSVGVTDERLHVLRTEPTMEQVVQEARLGTELWRLFLLGALMIAIVEILVASRLKPESRT